MERAALGRGEEEAALRMVIGQLEGFARRVKDGLHEADWAMRRGVIRALVKRVEVGEDDVRVVYKVAPPSFLVAPTEAFRQIVRAVWAHVLAYSLIRTVMAQAAASEGIPPRSISFKATLQVLEAFRPLIASQAHRGAGHRAALHEQVLRAIDVHRVADRPDRFEPRKAERRPNRYDRLTRPRQEFERHMLKITGII